MIERISLDNFQSHTHTELDLHPGVNAIVGTSDSGKTAIIRALNWVVNNRPSGESFISNWAKDEKGKQKEPTCVTVDKASGRVERIRKSDFNGYKIIDHNKGAPVTVGDTTTLEAIKTDVPEQVSTFFNLSEVNLQKQLDAPFLLSNTGGEIARFFNRIIKLDDIDKALSLTDSKKRECNNEIKQLEASKESDSKALLSYTWIESAESLIEKAEKVQTKLDSLNESLRKLQETLSNYQNLSQQLKKIPDLTRAEGLYTELLTINSDISTIKTRVSALTSTRDQFLSLPKAAAFQIIDLEPAVEKAIKISDRIQTYKTQVTAYTGSLQSFKDTQQRASRIAENLIILNTQLPELCPECGNPYKKEHQCQE